MATSYAPDKFTLFLNLNESRIKGKEETFWAKGQWPVDQIIALANWATNEAEKVENYKGEQCVEIAQKLMPRTAKTSGNQFYLGIISDQKPPADPAPAQRFDDNEVL